MPNPRGDLQIRRAEDRGQGGFDWLDARHTFSFGSWRDPQWMGFRSLRVINEDRIAAAAGFGTHGHRNMEILTWVLDGTLQHRDSTGGGGLIRPGKIQYMSAGAGVQHSEINASPDHALHLLQIWILPDAPLGGEPRYAERDIGSLLGDGLVQVASPDGAEDSFRIRSDSRLFIGRPQAGAVLEPRDVHARRHFWLQVAKGRVVLDGHELRAGDAAFGPSSSGAPIEAQVDSEVLLFDLA